MLDHDARYWHDPASYQNPGAAAYAAVEGVADLLANSGGTSAAVEQEWLEEFVQEVCTLAPGVRQSLIAKLDEETVESAHRVFGEAVGLMFDGTLRQIREHEEDRE